MNGKSASQKRVHAEHPEVIAGHNAGPVALGTRTGTGEIDGKHFVGGGFCETVVLVSKVEKLVVVQGVSAVAVDTGIEGANFSCLPHLGPRIEEHSVGPRENRCYRGDAQRECEHRNRREPWILLQLS